MAITCFTAFFPPYASAGDYFEQPSSYPPNSPERVVVQMGSDWQAEKFGDMLNLFDPSWAKDEENPESFIHNYIFNEKLISFYTTGTESFEASAKTTFTTLQAPSYQRGFNYDKQPYEVALVKKSGQWKIDLNSLRSLDRQFSTQQGGIENCINSN